MVNVAGAIHRGGYDGQAQPHREGPACAIPPVVVFGGSRINWINNHMNCGRYPVFHVLREEEVLAAVDKLDGNASRVCRSNVNLLGRMEGWYGREGAA